MPSFVANALDYLVGSDALTDLRGRDVTSARSRRVAEIRHAAESQYRAKEQDLLQKLTDLQQKLSSAAGRQRGRRGRRSSPTSRSRRSRASASQLLDTRQQLRDVQLACARTSRSCRSRIRFF